MASGVDALLAAHFDSDDIQIVVTAPDGSESAVRVRNKQEMVRGAVIGGIAGAVLSGLATTLVASGAIATREVGLLADHVLLAALQGVVLGGGLGSLTGLIVGMAIWRTTVELPVELDGSEVRVGVRAHGPGVDRAKRALEGAGALAVTTTAS